MAELTIFCPTRGRPGQLADFASEFYSHCTADTKVVFVLDEDDLNVPRYKAKNAGRWELYVAHPTNRGMVGALNAAWRYYNYTDQLEYAVGFLGDDHRPRTHGWDAAYLETLHSFGTGFVYGNDLYQGETMPTQVAFTNDIARALGYMCPPELDHLCVDVIWKHLGQAIDRIKYLPEVIVEHMHPLAGKAKNDKQYRAVNSNLMARKDGATYNGYMDNGRFAEDVGRIKMMMENGYTENR